MLRFVSLSVPTMCVMTGDTLAGGLIFSMCHDFRISTAKANIQLTEIDVGLSMATPFSNIIKHTIGTKSAIVMGERMNGKYALKENIVNDIYDN